MTATVASFRTNFPAFADGTRFPNSMIQYNLDLSLKFINAARWGTVADDGSYLFAAHQCVLERKSMDEADAGLAPGQSTGMINNKSVDKVSIGYDTQGGAEADAGHWNLTTYGTRFIRMARMMGMGGIQIGVGNCSSDPLSSQNAWSGPPFSNFPNPSG